MRMPRDSFISIWLNCVIVKIQITHQTNQKKCGHTIVLLTEISIADVNSIIFRRSKQWLHNKEKNRLISTPTKQQC